MAGFHALARVRVKRICNKREDVIYYILTDFEIFHVPMGGEPGESHAGAV